MVAGQSCIAGPSVCFPWCHVRFLYEPHLPFSRIGNKKCTADAVCGKSASADACTAQAHTPCVSGQSRACTPTAPAFLSSNLISL